MLLIHIMHLIGQASSSGPKVFKHYTNTILERFSTSVSSQINSNYILKTEMRKATGFQYSQRVGLHDYEDQTED